MAALYFVVRVLVIALHCLYRWRACRAEAHFSEVTKAAEKEAVQCWTKSAGDNSARSLLAEARRQRQTQELADTIEAAESKAHGLAGAAEKLEWLRAKVSGYKGRCVPYLLGHAELALAWFYQSDLIEWGQQVYQHVRGMLGK